MEYVFIGIVIFLFVLAVFDLTVGVSNDAVNFLNSAIGSRAASFKTVIIIAAVGIFLGAVMSNGMMDIARNGIFRPEQLSFFDVMCIFTAVMVTDIILLDIFNSLGMPTSTTVSMVFELLGATFAVALFKIAGNPELSLGHLLNTEKAFEVILGIFLSVAIAFFFGTLVQYLSRLWFSFDYKKGLSWKIGIFGGIATTAIVYFLILKGAKGLTFMTPEVKGWISDNTGILMGVCFVVSTLVMQCLHFLKVNVFKIIVLFGTFALAMAFAGNDLVNFIGVPLTGFASWQDYVAHGGGSPDAFLMTSLTGAASTPVYFLIGAGVIMVVALATSRKAQKVVETSVNLSRQDSGEEMFGSSKLARRIVGWALAVSGWIVSHTPEGVRRWVGRRLDTNRAILDNGAAFDLVRGSINLVLAGMLIALGTSLKLPLSTTYVTFMVAMGTSLADRAWGRESAVFRITGVISVIGGWFITAGAAFIGAALIVSIMHVGGATAIVVVAVVAVVILLHSNLRRRKEETASENTLFQSILASGDKRKAWNLLKLYLAENQKLFLEFAMETQKNIISGFFSDNSRQLDKAIVGMRKQKDVLKSNRRKSTLCLRHVEPDVAIEMNTWFHTASNCQMGILYNLLRIAEVCHEHVDNHFRPLPKGYAELAIPLCEETTGLFHTTIGLLGNPEPSRVIGLRSSCDNLKNRLSLLCRRVYGEIRQGESQDMGVLYVYVNMLQEMQEIVSSLRKLLRADAKLMLSPETPIRIPTIFNRPVDSDDEYAFS